MSATLWLRAALGCCFLALFGLGTYSFRHAIDHQAEASFSHALRSLEGADAELNEELLKSRAGLVKHYDSLVAGVRKLKELHGQLTKKPLFLSDQAWVRLSHGLDKSMELLHAKEDDLESFKTHNSILRNSLHFLPTLSNRLVGKVGADDNKLLVKVSGLMSAVLSLNVTPARDASERLAMAVAGLETMNARAAELGAADEFGLLMSHGNLVARNKPLVDEHVRRILELPLGATAAQLGDVYSAYYRRALDEASLRQRVLFALGTLIVALGLTEVILRIQKSRHALETTSEELRRANEALAREREKERELGELKTRFVAMTSHEFRTPLSTILSSSELLEAYAERWDRERRQSHLERIKTAALNMTRMLDGILVIGKAEAGVLRPSPACINLEDFCRHVVESVELGGQSSIDFRFHGESQVVIDELLLRHVLTNLLENAIKYSPVASQVELEVDVREDSCHFVVRDHGIGIPEHDLPQIFQSFRRGSNVGQIGGSGLGMAVVARALSVQNGTIEIKSELGLGSEFRVAIPHSSNPPALEEQEAT